jgi:hypothetical protein
VKGYTRLAVLTAIAATGSLRLLRDLVYPYHIGFDGRLYTDASRVWLAGGDPWTATYEFGLHYGAPPPTLLVTAPLTLVPTVVAGLIMVVIGGVLALLAIRTLGLPAWWILWTPILDGVLVGSLDIAAMAALVLVAGRVSALAPFLKIYAVVPMLGERRWRSVAVAGMLIAATIPLVPWAMFLADWPVVTHTLATQNMSGSAWPSPILWIAFAIGLPLLGARRAGYLAVPVLWPNTQPHYGALALPIASSSAILAIGFSFAFVVPWVPLVAVAAVIALTVVDRERTRRAGPLPDAPGAAGPSTGPAG